MSNLRVILWLFVGIVALAVANFWLMRHGVDTELVRRTRLFRSVGDATRIVVTRAGALPTVLEMRDGEWRLVSPFAGAVEGETVMRFVDGLALASVSDELRVAELAKYARTRADFFLDRPTLTIEASSGRDHVERVSFGSATPSGDGFYASVDGDESVFVTPSNVFAAANLSLSDFRRRALVPIEPTSVVSVDVKRPAGSSLVLALSADGWTAGGQSAAADRVRRFISDLTASRASSFVWPTGATNEAERASSALLAVYGLDPESATAVTLKSRDGHECRVAFGLDVGENLVYALVEDGSAIVTVPSALADAVHQETLAFTDARLFPLEASAVSSFSLALGETICRVARAESGEWRLDSPIAAPADATVVSKMLNRLIALSSSDVASNGLTVSVTTNLRERIVSPNRVLDDLRLDDLRSKDILAIDPLYVKRIVSTKSNGDSVSVLYSRERHAWNVESANVTGTADEKSIVALLAGLNPLRADHVALLRVTAADLAKYGLDKPSLTVAVDQNRDDSVRRNILIGAQTPQGGRYATVGSSDAVFVLSDATVELLSRYLVVRLIDNNGRTDLQHRAP